MFCKMPALIQIIHQVPLHWSQESICCAIHVFTTASRKYLTQKIFAGAYLSGVRVLEMNICIWTMDHVYSGDHENVTISRADWLQTCFHKMKENYLDLSRFTIGKRDLNTEDNKNDEGWSSWVLEIRTRIINLMCLWAKNLGNNNPRAINKSYPCIQLRPIRLSVDWIFVLKNPANLFIVFPGMFQPLYISRAREIWVSE